jgi:flagellar basal-body rod protein FlgC
MSDMMVGFFRAAKTAASGLKVNRRWMNVISNNIANANTLDTGRYAKDGNFVPYARQVPIFKKVMTDKFRENKVNSDIENGVAVKGIANLNDKVNKVYDPSHPAARRAGTKDAGYVYYPAVSTWQEIADLKMASASYEANLTVMSVSNKMLNQALQISKGV